MRSLLRTLRFIAQHPLNRNHPLPALFAFLRWQIGSRIVPGAVAVPFVQGTRLLTTPGMAGATGNIYCGLHEFADMGVVLHALRPGDLFIDIGANIGSYTILAAGVCGASVIAVEPVPCTFNHLLDNIRLNNLESLVVTKCIAIGAHSGTLRFSEALDTLNHVLSGDENNSSDAISVTVDTLDAVLAGRDPTIIKIDVEGYESEVFKGATETLQSDKLLAVLMETDGGGNRYRIDEAKLHSNMVHFGFTPCAYDPMTRVLSPLGSRNAESSNTLYVKNIEALGARIESSPKRMIHGNNL